MRLFILIISLLGICGNGVSGFLITEFCPDPYIHDDADEYIVLSGTGLLDPVAVSDDKGGFRFPPGTYSNGTVTIARSGPAYCQSHGHYPDFEWQDFTPEVPDVISGDILRLANIGDMLTVYENGRLVQTVSWPGDVRTREGQVHYMAQGAWDPRPLMLGQSRFSSAVFHNVTVTAFVSPDSSLAAFASAVDGAKEEILVNIYEFSSPEITASLVAARNRNVSVTLLIEGGPVGGIPSEEKAALWVINQSGIPVYAMAPPKGGHAPYRYDHAKYLIIDHRSVVLASENFKYSGFPPAGTSGNRGWGVVADDPGLAGYFTSVFTTDLRDASVKPFTGTSGTMESVTARKYVPEFPPRSFTGASVRPVIAPDTSGEILTLIESASSDIEIEQAYITNESVSTLNPYLAAAVNASRRGVHVRVLLDSYWYNTEDPADNDEMAALVNQIAREEHLPLEARCADLATTGLEKIHNKGVIVDNRKVLVSSINWNRNSPNFNREAGLIIENPGTARYFHDVFDDDWNASVQSPEQRADYLRIAVVICVIVILMVFWYRRHCR